LHKQFRQLLSDDESIFKSISEPMGIYQLRTNIKPAALPKRSLTALLLLITASVSQAQQSSSTGTIQGRVTSREGSATIRLEKTSTGAIANRDGEFTLADVPVGTYTLTVTYVGHSPYSTSVEVNAGAVTRLQIILDERPSGTVVVTAPRSAYRVPTSSTATKTSTRLIETPASVQIITAEQLTDQRADRVNDAFDYMTGVTQGGGTRAQSYLLRGFAVDDRFIPYQIDGISGGVWRQHEPPAALIEHIEYLKGPATTLYGVTQLGGVLNYITKKPKAMNEATIELRHSTYASQYSPLGAKNSISMTADMTGPLTDDGGLLYRLIGSHNNITTFRQDIEESSLDLFPSIAWNFSEATQVSFSLNINVDKGRWDEYLPVPDRDLSKIPDIRTRINEPTDYYWDYGWGVGYILRHTLNENWTIRSVARYTARIDGRRLFEFGSLKADGRTLGRSWRDQFNERYYTYLDATIEGKLLTGPLSHTILGGATLGIEDIHFDRRNLKSDSTLDIDIYNPIHNARPLLPVKPGFDRYFDNDYIGAYLQDQITIIEELQVVLGAQFTQGLITHEERRSDLLFEKKNSGISPRAGLVLLPLKDLSVYASYSSSFSPTNAERENAEGNIDFDPELGKQIEFGAKTELFDGRIGITAAAFQLDYTNALSQTGDKNPNGNTVWVQTGESRSKGVELDLAVMPFDGLYVSAGYGYTDARVVADEKASLIGQRLPYVPYNTGNFRATYRFGSTLQGLKLGIGMTGTDARPTEFPTSTGVIFFLPSYTRLDAFASYDFDRATIAINLNNMTDEQYFASGGRSRIVPGAPRMLRTTLQMRL